MSHFSKQTIYVCIIAGLILGGFSIASAQFNEQINYQGKLTDESNITVADDSYNLGFRLCTTSDCTGGSNPIWTETHCYSPDNGATCDGTGTDQRVLITNGLFSVLLGSISSISSVNFDQTLYLEVRVGGSGTTPSWETLTPRKTLGAVPGAFEAKQLGGIAPGSFVRSDTADEVSGLLTVTAVPTGTGVGVGSLYINPASATADYTLLGLAVGGSQKFRLDADGDLVMAGTLGTSAQNALQLSPYGAVAGNTGEIRFLELAASGTNYVGFKAPDAITTNVIWTLPSADGSANQVLQTSGAGVLSWATAGGAPTDATYVTLSTNATLTAERVLTGTTNQITVTDGGANGNVTLSLPQDIHTSAIPQFARMGLGVAADGTNILTATSASTTDLSKTLNISHTGAITGTGYAGYFSKTGASTTNVALYATASGATNNYAAIFDSGNVGIGTAGPDRKLDVLDTSDAQLRLTYSDNSVYTDLTLDTNGNLTINPAKNVYLKHSANTGSNLWVCEGTACPGADTSMGSTGGNLVVEGGIYGGTRCPSDMVYIPGDRPFCIDKYEAYNAGGTVVNDTCTNGSQAEVDANTTTAIAGSASGQAPQVNINWCAAKKACQNAGKHLCTNQEWFQACNYRGGQWNITAEETAETMSCNTADECGGVACNTGASSGCVTQEGAYDMIGNVWEWVDKVVTVDPTNGLASNYVTGYDFATALPTSVGASSNAYGNDYFWTYNGAGVARAAVRGGSWSYGADGGCFTLGLRFAPSSTGTGLGFRCCR